METFLMSKKELDQLKVMERLKRKEIKQTDAALMLDLSTRQVSRKFKQFKEEGPNCLIHGLRGKPSNYQINPRIKKRALALITKHYSDFGPTLASEILKERHSLTIHPDTLRLAMIANGLWNPKTIKPKHREHRERMEYFGDLVQLDGSHHNWLEERGPKLCLVAFIDDAKGDLLGAGFGPEETTKLVMRVTKEYFSNYGRPLRIYSDRGKVFKVNKNNQNDEFVSQYGRAMEELGVKMIFANSPQAKGRVERLFQTLQDRLIKMMRINNISNLEQANKYLKKVYLPEHNRKFGKEPKKQGDLHRSVEDYSLDEILCLKNQRILKNDYTISYQNRLFQVGKKQPVFIQSGKPIGVSEQFDGNILLTKRQTKLNFKEISKRPNQAKDEQNRTQIKQPKHNKKPSKNHPWRQY